MLKGQKLLSFPQRKDFMSFTGNFPHHHYWDDINKKDFYPRFELFVTWWYGKATNKIYVFT